MEAAALARRARAVEKLRRLSKITESDDTPRERLSTVAAESDDTPGAAEQECNHFSLRGYVAMLQKKDPKLCSPIFHIQPQYDKPPALVSKYRRWDCSKCLDKLKVSGHKPTFARRARAVEEIRRLSAVAESDGTPAAVEQECNHFSLRFVQMEGGGLWTNMVMADGDDDAGLDDLMIPMAQDTQHMFEIPSGHREVDVEVQPHEVVERPHSTKGLAKRTKNFDPKEDVVVCSAWLNVSKDPIHGANQSRSKFWSRVHAFFEKHKETPYVRTESSLMRRWLTIQFQVNKYCSCYEAIERRNQSGTTIQEMISNAAEMYKELDKDNKTFTLIHCWNKLKAEDKWKAKRVEFAEQEKQASKKKRKVPNDSTPRDVEATNTKDVTENADPASQARKRPQGVKKAKEALKRGGAEACMEALDKMWAKKEAFDMEREKKKEERFLLSLEVGKKKQENLRLSLEVEKKRLTSEEKRAEAELIKQEKEIMSMDMASLTPLQRQYYETMQQQIITRRLANQI